MTMSLSIEAINLLRQNARAVVRELGLLNDAYFEIGVTLAERHLLIELSVCQSPTMKEIAERLLIDKSTASRLISKAIKKGYVKFSADKKDKRKKILQLTRKGSKTLNAFEIIAFKQTKEALLNLNADEIGKVHQGVALYAQGLKASRLKTEPCQQAQQIESLPEILDILKQQGYQINLFKKNDEAALHKIFKEIVDCGCQFTNENGSLEEFRNQFFNPNSKVYVCHTLDGTVIGGFYIKPNFGGRSRHVANAAYMIDAGYRGKGIGSQLVKVSLHFARELGYTSMQFNMVFSSNTQAIKLYQKFGFSIIGTIPEAIRNQDGSYQDGYIMHRKLNQELI